MLAFFMASHFPHQKSKEPLHASTHAGLDFDFEVVKKKLHGKTKKKQNRHRLKS